MGLALALLAGTAAAQVPEGPQRTYKNAISHQFADTFADPAVIEGKDGYWYAYATSDPLTETSAFGNMHVARSRDLVDWQYVGEVFPGDGRPTWADPASSYWAPDIRYLDGRYVIYYTVTNTVDNPQYPSDFDTAIGVATAPTPTGPWTDSGAPVVGPRPDPGNPASYLWTFDPALFSDSDGRHYLYVGSYYGGIFVTELNADGTRAVGELTRVTVGDRYEGAFVVRHDDGYYLFGSSANCCAGPSTGYSVFAGRADSPLGPFVDREGVPLIGSRVGGTLVVTPNGNRWIGTGHNAVITDEAGQDWFVYHAIDRSDPYLTGGSGINERPMLMDRLDWIDGWPVVRGGAFASDDVQPAPAATDDDFNQRAPLWPDWRRDRGRWLQVNDGDQGFVRQALPAGPDAFLLDNTNSPTDARVEGDLRVAGGTAAGLVVRFRNNANYAAAWLDAGRNALVTDVRRFGRSSTQEVALPVGFRFDQWHELAVEVRGSSMTAEVSDAGLNDPYAVAQRTLPAAMLTGGEAGAAARGVIDVDNLGVAELYTPQTERAAEPQPGAVISSDEFDDETLTAGWSWVREPAATETGDNLTFPVQQADLVGGGNNASLLLTDAPEGDWIAETKLSIDLGEDVLRNFQQGGMVAYVDDDLWVRLSQVAIFNTRQHEFGKEQRFADGLPFGGMIIGPTAPTSWLRLAHRIDPENGEHEYRAGTSRDGDTWFWGGTWTLPADTDPRIGLIAHGWNGTDEREVAEFDYFRFSASDGTATP